MAIKIFGSICVMFGIVGTGMALALKEKFKLDNLRQLKKNINMLMSELLYNREMFYNALKKISKNSGELSVVYKEILKGLDNNNSVQLSWKYAFEKYKNDLFIDNDELETISNFGKIFSSADYSYQQSEFNNMSNYLQHKIKKSDEKWQKDFKLYRSIAITSAAFVVILLF